MFTYDEEEECAMKQEDLKDVEAQATDALKGVGQG